MSFCDTDEQLFVALWSERKTEYSCQV